MSTNKEGESLLTKIKKIPGEVGDLALARLLEWRVQKQDGRLGDRVWFPAQKTFIFPYVEVAILSQDSSAILLDHRVDEYWDGWHIPGGRWQNPKLDVNEACSKVSQRELGVGVRFLKDIMFHKWDDHPYGYPLSLVCLCESQKEIPETETRRFFTEVPNGMVPHHGDFLQATFDYLRVARS